MEKVSIIIPAFNSEKTIIETLNSVKFQDFMEFECIIVDDGSHDKTAFIIQNYIESDKRFFFYERPNSLSKGPSSCRNFGIKKANSDLIIFLDSDDKLSLDCLAKRIKYYNEFPQYDFWVFNTLSINTKDNSTIIFNKKLAEYSEKEYLLNFLSDNIPFCVSSVLWKKISLEVINGFDENLTLLEDPDLHIRAIKFGLKIKTCTACEPDNFYFRSEKTKYEKTFLNKIYINYKYFFNKYIHDHKNEIKISSNKLLKSSLKNHNFLYSLKYFRYNIKNRFINKKQFFSISMLLIYQFFNFEKIKHIGFQFLINKTFNK